MKSVFMRKLVLIVLFAVLIVPSHTAQPVAIAQGGTIRRVNVPYFSDEIAWAETGIFWFGKVDPPRAPGQNYADVRVAYTAEELVIYVNIEDYYIWYDTDATSTSDLTLYDAVAVYLDTSYDRAASPQLDDYLFLSGLCLYGCGNGSNYRREARGTRAEWDFAWQGDWTDGTWASWFVNPGFNDNQWDYGWWSYIHIPWSTVGLSGPPPQGTLWGLGVLLHDRDSQPPADAVAPEHWPETFDADAPSTWGELAFGLASYTPPPALSQGTTVIRRGLGSSVVEDAWVGGGANCTGGHEGDPEHDNHGGDTGLYVENQSLIADFTCFSKSFLRFYLDDIPPGKTIISATLTLHHWGNAYWVEAQPSLIWLFTVDGDWGEYTLTWNNAPLACENLSRIWVDVITPGNSPGWPGVPYDWDATQAVAEAYAAGEPLNVALYTADTNFHSSKYFTSSETGDWNEEGRPKLTVVWGRPVATVDKQVRPVAPSSGEVITYTMVMIGSGSPLTLTDTLPEGLSIPGSIQATEGSADYNATQRRVEWSGTPAAGRPVTVTFSVTVQISGPVALINIATLTDAIVGTSTDTAMVIVDGFRTYLPLVMKE